MKFFQRSTMAVVLSCGLASLGGVPAVAAASGWFQEGDWHQHLRGIVDRTQNDLQAAAQLEQGPKERQRYRRAQTQFSAFDRKLSKGHFDNGDLKSAIGELQDILSHNTLQASTRDALVADMSDLQAVERAHSH